MHAATLGAVARLSANDFRTRAKYADEDGHSDLRDRFISLADELDRIADSLKQFLTETSDPNNTIGASYVPTFRN